MLNFLKKIKIKKQLEYLKELRPLPLGVKEFDEWSKEIIRLAKVPGLTIESGQFALSEMILHVKPTQSFESYGHFVHSLRKGAANQVAHSIFQDLKKTRADRDEKEKHTAIASQAQNSVKAREQSINKRLASSNEQKILATPKF